MGRRRQKLARAAVAVALAITASADATTTVTVPFRGVTRYERIEAAGVVAPGKQVINILEIDLSDPTLSLFLTPPNGADPGEVTGATTRGFLTANSLQFAVNGMRFSDSVTPNPNHYYEVNAISVADGVHVSPWAGGGLPEGAVNLSSTKVPTLVTKTGPNSTSYNTVPSITLYNTIGGRNLILKAGVVQPPLADDSNVANPRTGVGFKNGFLYTMTVDGRSSAAAGMTVTEMATLMKNDYGLTDMVNLDGGGSTTLVFADLTPRVINTPSDGSERLVANNVGFRATVMQEWKVNSSANWNTASNWTIGVPNAEAAAVRFGPIITTPRTITSNLSGGASVGLLQFDHTVSYTLAGTQPLSLNATTGNAAVVDVKRGSHTITTPLTLIDATDLNVATGATLTLGSTVTPSTSNVLTKKGAGTLNLNTSLSNIQLNLNAGSTAITTPQTLAGLVLASGSTTTVTAGGVRTINTNSIAATGTLDLSDQKLVTRTAAGTPTGTIYSGVQGLVQRGHNNGTGLITTMPAAATGLTTLAVASATDTAYVGKTFGGVSVTAADTLVMYTWNGDANLSGFVDADDYFQIDSNYARPTATRGSFNRGDFNYDSVIDGDDYALIDAAFSAHGTPFDSGIVAVPEPSSVAMIVMLGLCRRRSRRL